LTEFVESEVGAVLLLLAVMGLGYVTTGWLKEQSRKRRDVLDEAEHMRRELAAFRQELLNQKEFEEPEKEELETPCFAPSGRHPLLVSGGDKKRSSAAFSDASTAIEGSCCSGSASVADGLETDDSTWEEEDEKTAEAARY